MFKKWTIFSFSYLLIRISNYLLINSHVVLVYAVCSYHISIVLLVQSCFDNNFINQNGNIHTYACIVFYCKHVFVLTAYTNLVQHIFRVIHATCPQIAHKSVVFPLFCQQKTNNCVCCCFLYTPYAFVVEIYCTVC